LACGEGDYGGGRDRQPISNAASSSSKVGKSVFKPSLPGQNRFAVHAAIIPSRFGPEGSRILICTEGGYVEPKAAAILMAVLMVIAGAGAAWVAHGASVQGQTESLAAAKSDNIMPGQPKATATIHCIGVMWPVEGDGNGTATCAVSFRERGTGKWREAMPLYRKAPYGVPQQRPGRGGASPGFDGTSLYIRDHAVANYLAGSIFGLKPGTAYEVKLNLAHRDDGFSVEKTLTITTRTEPVLPKGRPKSEVTAAGGAQALVAALEAAKAGDTIAVHKGTYQGPFRIAASGTPGRPIVIRGAGDGRVVIQGPGYKEERGGEDNRICLQIDGSHIFVSGLEFEDAVTAIHIGPGRFIQKDRWDKLVAAGGVLSDIAVTRCTTRRTQYAIIGTAHQCYIADNDLNGQAADIEGIDWSEGEGVEIHGSASVICYNRIHHLADAVSVYNFTDNQDVYNNETWSNSDDGIELDYSDANNRVWDNRFWFSANNGVSFQPYIGGPAYVVRNEVIGPKENSSKDRYGASDAYFINNTFVGHKADPSIGRNCRLSSFDMPRRCISRNNLYLIQEAADLPAVNIHAEDVTNHTVNMDYDGIGGVFVMNDRNGARTIDPAMYPGSHYERGIGLYVPIDSFRKVAGTLAHYTVVDPANLFQRALPAMHDWRVETPRDLMLLREGSNAIDAGTVVPTITDGFAGKAPDLGAHEFGRPAPHYGPR
jgi:hypothetical protein